MSRQPLRSLRVPDHIWSAAMDTAKSKGESLNSVTNRLLAAYGGVDAAPTPWVTQPDQVLAFGHILAAAGVVDTAAEALYYLEKPYKWDDVHDEWERLGRPNPPSRDDLDEARMLGAGRRAGELARKSRRDQQGWAAFLQAIEARERR